MITATNFTPVASAEDPFFFADKPVKRWYMIYNDGGHYIAKPFSDKRTRAYVRPHAADSDEEKNMLFENLYFNAMRDGLKRAEMTEYLTAGMRKLFPDDTDMPGYIERRTKRVISNLHKRIKRFRRKANLNRWNYFVTITYDDDKHTEDTFRCKLRKCLSNLHTRRGWKYMGVFELAPETGRLHFHGIVYVPDNEMPGRLTLKRDYSTKARQIQETTENSFFARNYGRNDFKAIHPQSVNYLLKYIGKTNERIVYSRGVPDMIAKELPDSDLAAPMWDFVKKYVLFDDVVDWEKDVVHATPKQLRIWDFLRRPSAVCPT